MICVGTRAQRVALAAALTAAMLMSPAEAMASATYHMELRGGVDGVVCDTDNLFGHMPFLEPGGSDSGNVEIANASGKTQRLWLVCDGWTRYSEGEAAKLLEGVSVSTTYDGRIIWEGAIGSQELGEPHLLGVLAPGEASTFRYVLDVDPDLMISDPVAENAVRWSLVAEEVPDGATAGPGGGGSDGPSGALDGPGGGGGDAMDGVSLGASDAADAPADGKGSWLAQTGDEAHIAGSIAAAAALGAAAALAVRRIRKGGAPWSAR